MAAMELPFQTVNAHENIVILKSEGAAMHTSLPSEIGVQLYQESEHDTTLCQTLRGVQ